MDYTLMMIDIMSIIKIVVNIDTNHRYVSYKRGRIVYKGVFCSLSKCVNYLGSCNHCRFGRLV